MTMLTSRVGVDIGGTFTDIVLEHSRGLTSCKVLTDYADPSRAILFGIEKVAREANLPIESIEQVIHGTTLVTNALIERRGARMAFITTEGFRDVIEMRAENRFEQYDLNLQLPAPLVAREHRFTANERLGPDGQVLLPFDLSEAAIIAEQIVSAGYEAVAIGFMHAYANPTHERIMAEALHASAPNLPVSLSSEISPQMRELQRFNSVVVNAYVQPMVALYIDQLMKSLQRFGIDAPVFMMHSGGGLISVETAIEQPIRLLESGPAGGAIFAADFARTHNQNKALSFDMGGTTAKICLIENYNPKTAGTFEIARTYRFKKGSGIAVSTPVVEMVEIGAGGGSIASFDAMGRIQVGPRSASSEPGPACYGKGGLEPTVTDANLCLGRIDPNNFAGGTIKLDVKNATRALELQLQGLCAEDAAFAVTEMVDENMANAARVHTVENGRDIEDYTMIAFGGGAPLHACRECEKLGIDKIIIPPGAGVGSAIGFLRAPFSFEATRGLFQRLINFDAATVNLTLAAMKQEAEAFVRLGARGAKVSSRLVAFMRYSGQGWEIPVEVKLRAYTDADSTMFLAEFETAYRQLFGRIIDGLEVEITNWSLTVAAAQKKASSITLNLKGHKFKSAEKCDFFDAALRKKVSAALVERSSMQPDVRLDGPAMIIENETATIVTSGFTAIRQDDGSLLLLRKETAQ
jgi:N-methylhydantoinase A